jgi:rare lipoprotein A
MAAVSGQAWKIEYLAISMLSWSFRSLLIALVGVMLASCASASYPGPSGRIKNSPYVIGGIQYVPYSVDQARYYDEVGVASWYGPDRWLFGGSEITANGESVDSRSVSAAHKLLPLPSKVEVTNLRNGKRVVMRVNDRGPFIHGRMLDVSSRAAELLDFKPDGLTDVRVRVLRVGD